MSTIITRRQALITSGSAILLGSSTSLFAQADQATLYKKGEAVEVFYKNAWLPGKYEKFYTFSSMAKTPHAATIDSGGLGNFAPDQIRKPTGNVAQTPKKAPALPTTAAELTALENAVIAEINELRAKPTQWATKLAALQTSYSFSGSNYVDVAGEGSWSNSNMPQFQLDVKEAIDALNNTGNKLGAAVPPLGALTKNDVLRKVADMMASDAGKIDGAAHKDSAGRTLFQRADAQSYKYAALNECIPGGTQSAFGTVAQLIIDNGVTSRGHRVNLVAKGVTQIGVAAKYWPANPATNTSAYVRIVIVCGAPKTA